MIRPTGNKILIQLEKASTDLVNNGGIFVPGTAPSESQKGTIVALGSGKRDNHGNVTPFEVAINDVVLIGKFGGMEVKFDDIKYILVTEEEILGILVNE